MRQTVILLMGAITSLSACVAGDDPGSGDVATDDRWEAFKRAAVKIADTPVPLYRLGGDMLAVGDDGLRREYERYFGSAGSSGGVGWTSQPLTVDNVGGADVLLETRYADSGGGRYNLTYCIERNTFSASQLAALEPALDAATDSWNGLVNVAFRHEAAQDATCGSGNTSVFFNVRNVSAGAFFGMAFFPHDPRAVRELQIDDSAFTTSSGGRDLQGILRHETGHILGFRHEQIWIDCTGEDVGDARHVTPYDVDSVMHYPQCRPSGTGGYRQSDLDWHVAIGLYGLSTAEIMIL